jgi:hypothetical protein
MMPKYDDDKSNDDKSVQVQVAIDNQTSTMGSTNDDGSFLLRSIIDEIEHLASVTVLCIQTIIDEIRSINQFKSNTSTTSTGSSIKSNNKNCYKKNSTTKTELFVSDDSLSQNSNQNNNNDTASEYLNVQLYNHLCLTKVRYNNYKDKQQDPNTSSFSVQLLPELIHSLHLQIIQCKTQLQAVVLKKSNTGSITKNKDNILLASYFLGDDPSYTSQLRKLLK